MLVTYALSCHICSCGLCLHAGIKEEIAWLIFEYHATIFVRLSIDLFRKFFCVESYHFTCNRRVYLKSLSLNSLNFKIIFIQQCNAFSDEYAERSSVPNSCLTKLLDKLERLFFAKQRAI